VSTRVADGYYIHADRKEIDSHFLAHQKQGNNLQKLPDKRYHRDFCAHCYPLDEDEFGSSEVFDYFIKRKSITFDIIFATGKTRQYYVQAYKAIANEEYKKNKIISIIKKFLKSLAYGAPRNLSQDAQQVFLFIKESCEQIFGDSDQEQPILNVEFTPDIVNKGKAVDFGIDKFNTLHFDFETEVDETYGFTDLHLLAKGVNTLAGLINQLNTTEEEEELQDILDDFNEDNHTITSETETEESDEEFEINQQNFIQALQGILGENGEHLRSEQGILTVEPFDGKSTEDPVSWLAKFERAYATNRWSKARLIDIAGGLMKGEAAAWFETLRGTWGDPPRFDQEDVQDGAEPVNATHFKMISQHVLLLTKERMNGMSNF
jgi:hypothetical protein